jgi:hypothetical protein
MRFHARTDANHQKIIDAFRQLGCTVKSTHQLGNGFPDLIVGIDYKTHLVEVKDQKGELTADQVAFIDLWRGSPVQVIRNVEGVVRFVNDVRGR